MGSHEPEKLHNRKNIFTNSTSESGKISNIYMELQKLDTNQIIKQWSTELNRILNRGILDGQETIKKKIDVLHYQ